MYAPGGGTTPGALVSTGGALVASGVNSSLALIVATIAVGLGTLMLYRTRMLARREAGGSSLP